MMSFINRRTILSRLGITAVAAAGAATVPTIVTAAECPDVADKLALIHARYEAVNAHDWARFQSYYHDEVSWDDPGLSAPLRGPAAVRQRLETWVAAFPDLQWSLDEAFAADDKVCALFTFTGTHDGDLALPNGRVMVKSHRRIRLRGAGRYGERDRKIHYSVIYFDLAQIEHPYGA